MRAATRCQNLMDRRGESNPRLRGRAAGRRPSQRDAKGPRVRLMRDGRMGAAKAAKAPPSETATFTRLGKPQQQQPRHRKTHFVCLTKSLAARCVLEDLSQPMSFGIAVRGLEALGRASRARVGPTRGPASARHETCPLWMVQRACPLLPTAPPKTEAYGLPSVLPARNGPCPALPRLDCLAGSARLCLDALPITGNTRVARRQRKLATLIAQPARYSLIPQHGSCRAAACVCVCEWRRRCLASTQGTGT